MGTSKGAPIPIVAGTNNNFIKDKEGNVVISRIDETSLAQVARAGDGAYIPANNISNGINSLVDELSGLDKSEMEARVYSEYEDKAAYVQLAVLALLALDLAILMRKNPRLAAFDIFTRKKARPALFLPVGQVTPQK